jgi:Zn-dependent M28 family amino/carboxypeptidase
VAEAFSMLAEKPARSVIFLTVSGEERGLWGSRYFSEHPVVPIEQIVADLNSDMISRNARDTIVAIGKEHSDLGETLARVNAAHPELDLTAIDDIWPEENFYRRSDHFNFARRGVPILFFFCGTTEHYHQPSDEVDTVDGVKATNTSKLLFYLGLEIANAPERPQWNPDSYAEIVDMGGGRE